MKRLMPCFAMWSLATALGVTPLVVPPPAHADVHVGIWLPGPPVVVGPPVLVAPPPVVYGSLWYGSPGRWHRHHHGHRRHHGHGRHHGGWHRH